MYSCVFDAPTSGQWYMITPSHMYMGSLNEACMLVYACVSMTFTAADFYKQVAMSYFCH